MASLSVTAQIGTAEEFRRLFTPEQANDVDSVGAPLLASALANTNPDERYEISNLLLDCGARADFHSASEGETALRILLGALEHDPQKTTELMLRLIDAGADVNARSNRSDGVLDSLFTLPYGDEIWAPIYDIVFSRVLTGLHSPNRAGLTPLVRAERREDQKPELKRRIEDAIERQAE